MRGNQVEGWSSVQAYGAVDVLNICACVDKRSHSGLIATACSLHELGRAAGGEGGILLAR